MKNHVREREIIIISKRLCRKVYSENSIFYSKNYLLISNIVINVIYLAKIYVFLYTFTYIYTYINIYIVT